MYVLALTGGLAAGKSTAASIFSKRGAFVIDADEVAKGLLEEVPVVRERLIAAFGADVCTPEGQVDHMVLAQKAFRDQHSVALLNSIVHPATYAAIAGALDALSVAEEPPEIVVLAVPLLVEYPQLLEVVDAVLAISASEDVRLERAIARGMTQADAEQRMARQAGDAERREIADYVIENDGTIEEFKAALGEFWDREIAPRRAQDR